ncbi:MAG: hypothetical protein C4334_02165 [Pyrinomonas sp.]|uniref:cell division protein FtsQ/DivIB n=1 Tax=Pyrinomonas sp. TaxID=2080306 RepID=UPI003323BA5A
MSAVKEQLISPRARHASPRSASAQRPARRARAASRSGAWSERWSAAAPWIGKALIAAVAGVLLFMAYRAATSASIFQLARVDVEGVARTPPDQVQAVVRNAVGRDGVWRADVWGIKREIEKLPWVREAVVSRVLPSAVRVRVRERTPFAVARISSGRFVWVDEEGVLLGQFAPTDEMPPFLVRGLDEAPTEAAHRSNRDRLARYREMLDEWRARGLIERVSEVNLEDLRDVRAQLAGEDAGIEIRLGGRDFGLRLERALKALTEMRQAGREVVSLDATQDRRIVVGLASGARLPSDGQQDRGRVERGANEAKRKASDGRREE